MAGEVKLNLVSMDQTKNEKLLCWFEWNNSKKNHWHVRKDEPLPKHICILLARYKDVFINEVLQKLLPTKRTKSPNQCYTTIQATIQGTTSTEPKGIAIMKETT